MNSSFLADRLRWNSTNKSEVATAASFAKEEDPGDTS